MIIEFDNKYRNIIHKLPFYRFDGRLMPNCIFDNVWDIFWDCTPDYMIPIIKDIFKNKDRLK